ncbi:thiolase [Periconia macrospinosa]|uniref:acetyl-CoA C-acetyltransferase n=1 Tax=Periconia macrospinosa TaxID=97972 RepID=A0A2V1DZ29_9PLEO|nr:thiolase [Periconia macrospinosa]
MTARPPVYIVASVRTGTDAIKGRVVNAVDLGSHVIKAAINRVSRLKGEDVEEVFMGNVLSTGLGQNVARQCALGVGLPVTTVCTTINKVCASSMKALTLATETIQLGYADVVIAGGMESMSNAPNYVSTSPTPTEEKESARPVINSVIRYGLTDAYINKEHIGMCKKERELYTERKAQEATKNNWCRGEIAPIKLDEAKLRELPPLFATTAAGGTVTAANSSGLSDGASAVVLPLARILSWADVETHPGAFTTAPALALPKALSRANVKLDDVNTLEINEAFAVAALTYISFSKTHADLYVCHRLANIRILKVDEEKVNKHGGAVSLGHALGNSGTRVLTSLLGIMQKEQKEKNGEQQIGAAAVCAGGGSAVAVVMEATSLVTSS